MRPSPARLARSAEHSAGLFTILPVRGQAAQLAPGDGVAALLWLPAVGAALGAAAGLPATAIRQWSPHANGLGAVLAIAALATLTRCLHLDGLADTADGLGSRAPAERALEIMKKSDIGPLASSRWYSLCWRTSSRSAACPARPGRRWPSSPSPR